MWRSTADIRFMDHRARFTRIIAAMAVIAATTLVGLPGIASAAPGEGSISGTVFDDQGSPLPNVCVYVQNYGSTTTDPFGTYSLTNIPVGQYRIQFSDCNDPRVFVTQWYLGQPDESTAQYVDVYDQMDTSLNNVSMQQWRRGPERSPTRWATLDPRNRRPTRCNAALQLEL